MSNLIIGIVGKSLEENSFGVTLPYMKFFNNWGSPVIISPHPREDLSKLFSFVDVFVLPGGEDIYSGDYEEVPDYYSGRPSTQLEYFDNNILPEAIASGKKIIGICRGLQAINVYFGGTLNQHMYWHKRSSFSRDELVHKVKFSDGKEVKVNSLHHQGIKRLGDNLNILATSEDGVIEAIKHNRYPIFAVQWHPEEILDSYTISYIDSMLKGK